MITLIGEIDSAAVCEGGTALSLKPTLRGVEMNHVDTVESQAPPIDSWASVNELPSQSGSDSFGFAAA